MEFKAENTDFKTYMAANPDAVVISRGADGSCVVAAASDIPPSPAPQSVTPRQIRLALNAAGLRSTVEAAVAAESQDLRDWWEYALEIERDNALIVGMAAQLGITSQQVDDLFQLAATL